MDEERLRLFWRYVYKVWSRVVPDSEAVDAAEEVEVEEFFLPFRR